MKWQTLCGVFIISTATTPAWADSGSRPAASVNEHYALGPGGGDSPDAGPAGVAAQSTGLEDGCHCRLVPRSHQGGTSLVVAGLVALGWFGRRRVRASGVSSMNTAV